MSKPQPAYKISVKLGDGSVMDNSVSAENVFGAVKFIQDEAAKNGWFVVDLLVESFSDADVADAIEVPGRALQ